MVEAAMQKSGRGFLETRPTGHESLRTIEPALVIFMNHHLAESLATINHTGIEKFQGLFLGCTSVEEAMDIYLKYLDPDEKDPDIIHPETVGPFAREVADVLGMQHHKLDNFHSVKQLLEFYRKVTQMLEDPDIIYDISFEARVARGEADRGF